MNKRLLRLFCAFALLAVPMAGLSEQAETAGESSALPTTDKEKVELAHKLLGEPGKKPDALALIKEVGFQKFLEPVMNDEAALVKVLDRLVGGASTSQESIIKADIYTYLLKDKRPAVRDRAIAGVEQLAIYADKPFVSDRLFELYKEAGDDADLRAKLVPALMACSMPDPENKEMRGYGPADYEKGLERVPTLFEDADWRVRAAAVRGLPKSMDAMHKTGIGTLEHDHDGRVRAALIDFYRETKIKTQPAREMALRGLEGKQVEELVAAITYCATMKMDEAREPMYAFLEAHAGPLDEKDPTTFQIRQLKRRIIDTTIVLQWKEAIPQLLELVDREADWHASAQAAYAVLRLSGVKTLKFGPTEEVFPNSMVKAEYTPMITAFRAWRLREYEGQGDTAEVRRLDEDAQKEFFKNVYEIAEQRLLDGDMANKKRGLDLVMTMGPDDFASKVRQASRLRSIYVSLEIFPTKLRAETEVNRKIARMVLGFLKVDDVATQMTALQILHGMANYCERDETQQAIAGVIRTATDKRVEEAADTTLKVVTQFGYDKSQEAMKENLRYKEEEPDTE